MFFAPKRGSNCWIKTGTYVGDGNINHNIAIGLSLSTKSSVYIIIKSVGVDIGVHRIEYGQGAMSMYFAGIADGANIITSLSGTGFILGSSTSSNGVGITYRYIVFWAD